MIGHESRKKRMEQQNCLRTEDEVISHKVRTHE
jgi:hypothetical protein